MDYLEDIVKFFTAFVLVIVQQSLIIGIALLIYGQGNPILGIIISLLCFPMIWVNRLTVRYIYKNGIGGFFMSYEKTFEQEEDNEHKY